METADCERDTTGAVEWLRRQGKTLDKKQALEYYNERSEKLRTMDFVTQKTHFPEQHRVHEKREDKYYPGNVTTPEEEAVLETTLPADSTDKRVVRRRAALAAALGYEYERMKWLAGYSINYRVGNDGVPVPKDAPFILARV